MRAPNPALTAAQNASRGGSITRENIAAYIKAKRCAWCTPEQIMASPAAMHRVRAFVYAGENHMRHHMRPVQNGGMIGGLEVMANVYSAESAKAKAGACLVGARELRALGYPAGTVSAALAEASKWRREAAMRVNARPT